MRNFFQIFESARKGKRNYLLEPEAKTCMHVMDRLGIKELGPNLILVYEKEAITVDARIILE